MIYSCGNNSKVPKDLVSKEKMVQVYEEIRVLEAIKFIGNNDTALRVDSDAYYAAIFKKFNVDKEAFEKTHQYYLVRPNELAEIYEKVEENLHERKAKVNAESDGAPEVKEITVKPTPKEVKDTLPVNDSALIHDISK